MDPIPNSYYIGQEFAEDKEQIEVEIMMYFYSKAVIEPFEFYYLGKKIVAAREGAYLKISFNINISKKLAEMAGAVPVEEFIIGYISDYLPRINNEILAQRYKNGHFLAMPFSTLDISMLVLKRVQTKDEIKLDWPIAFSSFPPCQNYSDTEIYINDCIDAGNAYFLGNYDDCIRKIITSVENFFSFYKLQGSKKRFLFFKNSKFKNIVKNCIYSKELSHEVIANNLLFLYKIRNKIVHDKFRINLKKGHICDKGMRTLFYLYQFISKDQETSKYFLHLAMQFLALQKECFGINLDYMKSMCGKPFENKKVINTPEEMDKFMFEGLQITEKEKNEILKN